MSDRTRHFIVITLAGVLLVLTLLAMSVKAAHADPVVDHDPDLYVYQIQKVAPNSNSGILLVTLSNGKMDALRPCKYEDGTHCYWVASRMGNGIGRSFIVTRGILFYVNLRGL